MDNYDPMRRLVRADIRDMKDFTLEDLRRVMDEFLRMPRERRALRWNVATYHAAVYLMLKKTYVAPRPREAEPVG